jgi:uncharacterized protein YjbJ (UPF0337 family)
MTALESEGNWNIIKGRLAQKWGRLTHDYLQFAEGKHEELIGRIQKWTGETRENAENAVKKSAARLAKASASQTMGSCKLLQPNITLQTITAMTTPTKSAVNPAMRA